MQKRRLGVSLTNIGADAVFGCLLGYIALVPRQDLPRQSGLRRYGLSHQSVRVFSDGTTAVSILANGGTKGEGPSPTGQPLSELA